MIDIDRFKAYNDIYGHPEGDECLRIVSRCLQETMERKGDVVARYGGEEFVVVLPGTDALAASKLAECFMQRLEGYALPHKTSEFGVVAVSIGVATTSSQETYIAPGLLLKRADKALYEAKERGRNRSRNWPSLRSEMEKPAKPMKIVNS